MELMKAMEISAAGMRVQGMRMRVVSENIANANTVPGTPDEDPYRRKTVSFKSQLDRASGIDKIAVDKLEEDKGDFLEKYDPTHPSANEKGYVRMPNVNPLIEAMDMREAQRSYEANLGAIELSRGMVMKTIDMIGRQ